MFAVSYGGVTAAIDLRTGRRNWDKEVGGLETPWVAGQYIFMLTDEAELVCLSWGSGSVHWVVGLDAFEDQEAKEDPILWTGPVLLGDRLIVAGTNGQALSISPYDGKLLGSLEMPAAVTVPPVVANGTLYVLSNNGELVAFR